MSRRYISGRSGLKFQHGGRGYQKWSKRFHHLLWTGPYTEGKAADNIVLTKSYLDFPTDMVTHMFHSTLYPSSLFIYTFQCLRQKHTCLESYKNKNLLKKYRSISNRRRIFLLLLALRPIQSTQFSFSSVRELSSSSAVGLVIGIGSWAA